MLKPLGITTNQGGIKAYITNTDSDDISVVDLNSRQELTRVSIGGSSRGSVRFDPQRNFGYVSNCARNTVSVLDLNRNREVAAYSAPS
jgi:YVTN family beta-propeller protein